MHKAPYKQCGDRRPRQGNEQRARFGAVVFSVGEDGGEHGAQEEGRECALLTLR